MEAKAYLEQIEKIDRLIKYRKQEIEYLKESASMPDNHIDNTAVKSSRKVTDPMAERLVKVLGYEEELQEEIISLLQQRREIVKTLEMLKPKEQEVLYLRYVSGMTCCEIANELDYSYSNITTIHGRALKNLQNILNERTKALSA